MTDRRPERPPLPKDAGIHTIQLDLERTRDDLASTLDDLFATLNPGVQIRSHPILAAALFLGALAAAVGAVLTLTGGGRVAPADDGGVGSARAEAVGRIEGMNHVSWFRLPWGFILKRTMRSFSLDACTDLAASLTYFAVLSLFPAMIALVSILGLIGQSRRASTRCSASSTNWRPARSTRCGVRSRTFHRRRQADGHW